MLQELRVDVYLGVKVWPWTAFQRDLKSRDQNRVPWKAQPPGCWLELLFLSAPGVECTVCTRLYHIASLCHLLMP